MNYICAVPDIIKLLPDSIANQIAAGEVVQRPASVVKELLENALDAGATEIKLLIKDGGSTLIQVIDNGKGMSETDARMCWERYATSKMSKAMDLYKLKTFGFRGEALASIASVAQVEMKTRRSEDDAAVLIRIEGSKVEEQTLCASPYGTNISVRNLFYNIPARRNFLKSISVETRHIMEEFQRQALAYPQIAFSYFNNGSEVFQFKATSLAQRIVDCLGRITEADLLPVNEATDLVKISGYVAVPSKTRKQRTEQYFFANQRFIRSNYFAHAVAGAYEGTIATDEYPVYVLFLEVDPAKIDVNIHPTKTEVKFEEEKNIYAILKAAIRKSLGLHITPASEEFWGNAGITEMLQTNTIENKANLVPEFYKPNPGKPSYNPFQTDISKPKKQNYSSSEWNKVFAPPIETFSNTDFVQKSIEVNMDNNSELHARRIEVRQVSKIGGVYLSAMVDGEFYFFDGIRLQERILYETFKRQLRANAGVSQQLLFPRTLDPGVLHTEILLQILPELGAMGFDIQPFGGTSFIINGIPAEMQRGDEVSVLEKILAHYADSQGELVNHKHDSLALTMARNMVRSQQLDAGMEYYENLIQQLFLHPEGKLNPVKRPVFQKIGTELLQEMFNKK